MRSNTLTRVSNNPGAVHINGKPPCRGMRPWNARRAAAALIGLKPRRTRERQSSAGFGTPEGRPK